MMYDERIKRLEGYHEQLETLQSQLADDFHISKYPAYYDDDYDIAIEIFDELSGILESLRDGIWYIKKEKEAAA